MALSEIDRMRQAVAQKKQSALGEIENAAGLGGTQVAAADPVKNRGAYIDEQVDNAVNAPKQPATAVPPAAPAPTDAEKDAAVGIHIPTPPKAPPPPKKGLFGRIFGDAGDAAAPAAAAAGLGMTANTGINPNVPPGGLSAEAQAYQAAQESSAAGQRAGDAVRAAKAASPAVEAAAPAAEAAAKTGLGSILRGGLKVATGPVGAGIGSALYSSDAGPTTDLERQMYDADHGGPPIGAPAAAPAAAPGRTTPAGETVGPPTEAQAGLADRDAFLRKNGVSADDLAKSGALGLSDDERRSAVQNLRPEQGVNVNLGDYGTPGQRIFGSASKPGGRIDTFTGAGPTSGTSNGIDFGIKPGEVEAYKRSLERTGALGEAPRQPTFAPSKETTDALKQVQSIAAKLKQPGLSRKETRQLQAQLSAGTVALTALSAQDRESSDSARSNYQASLGEYNNKAARFDAQTAQSQHNAVDMANAQASILKAQNERAAAEQAAGDAREKTAYERSKDDRAELHSTLESFAASVPGLDEASSKQLAARMKTIADTKQFTDKNGKAVRYQDLSRGERAQQLAGILDQARKQSAQTNSTGLFGGAGNESITGQNPDYTPASFGDKADYLLGGAQAGQKKGLGDRFADLIMPGEILKSGKGIVPARDLTQEERDRIINKRKAAGLGG